MSNYSHDYHTRDDAETPLEMLAIIVLLAIWVTSLYIASDLTRDSLEAQYCVGEQATYECYQRNHLARHD